MVNLPVDSQSEDSQSEVQPTPPQVYQGQFGEFTITAGDRQGVILYRASLLVAALCFGIGAGLVLWQGSQPALLWASTLLFGGFTLALAVSLLTIHIYMRPLHLALQVFWGIGTVAAIALSVAYSDPLTWTVYSRPLTILGIGFTFAALTGLFFKEAFCFNRLETKFLTFLVPTLLLGHLVGILPFVWERFLLGAWAALFLVFALRKCFQAIPDDIGDKSVFEYLRHRI